MGARLRTLLVAVFLVIYALAVGPPTLLVAWLTGSSRLLYRVAVPPMRLALWMAGVRFVVRGRDALDPDRTYLFMPNHLSNVDPPVVLLALRRDARMMAKSSLFSIPVLGQTLRLAGFVPIVREDRDAAISAVQTAVGRLRQGMDFVVFPEGTRSRDGALLPLKKGPFFMAVDGAVPVVPVRVRGTLAILPRAGSVIHPGVVEVELLPPIDPARLDGSAEEVRERLREMVAAALQGDLTHSRARATPER